MTDGKPDVALSNLSHEDRRFPPTAEFAADAVAKADLYEQAAKDRLAFWDEQARRLDWETDWDQTLDWEPPFAKWFVGGRLNVAVNCVDRHVDAGNGDRVAFHWQGDPADDKRTITYADLKKLVCQAANALSRHASSQAGSSLRAEISRMVSSVSPLGARSISISVSKPHL